MQLTESQLEAANAILSSKPGSTLSLRGYAGTGKTVVASEAAKAAIEAERKVLVIAPTAAALAVLKGKLGMISSEIAFRTVASLAQTPTLIVKSKGQNGDEMASWAMDAHGLAELSSLLSALISIDGLFSIRHKSVGEIPLDSAVNGVAFDTVLFDSAAANKRLKAKFNSGRSPIGELSDEMDFITLRPDEVAERLAASGAWLVIGDEWSMVDAKMSSTIEAAVKIAAKLGADIRMMVCGDGGQLQPVNGSINSLIERPADGIATFELSENLRSQDEVVALATAVRGGMGIPEIAASRMFSNVFKVRSGSAVDAWLEVGGTAGQADVTLCFMNRDVNAINMLKRRQLGYGPEAVVGEAVVSLKNNGYEAGKTPALVNGELLTIAKVHGGEPSVARIEAALAERGEELTFAEKQFLRDVTTSMNAGALCLMEFETPLGEHKEAVATPILESRGSMAAKKARASLEALYPKLGIPFADLGFAYAMTVHKAQGSEWPRVLYIVSGKDLWVLRKSGDSWHMPYTAVTRAREHIDIAYVS